MERMIWLMPWVMTEIWLSTFESLMPQRFPTKEERDGMEPDAG